MNILVVTPYFYPHPGGSQRYIEELYSRLRSENPTIRIDVLTYNTENLESVTNHNGFKVYRIPCFEILRGQFALPNFFYLFKLLSELKKNHYDVLNAHTRFFDSSWWSPLLARYLGAIPLFTDHTATHPQHPNKFVRFVARLVDRLSIKWIDFTYSQATVVSNATKKFIVELGYSKQVSVIPGGVDLNFFDSVKDSTPLIPKYGAKPNDTKVIAFVGRLIPAKGARVFVDSAIETLKNNNNLLFLIAGDGSELESLKTEENNNIKFLGLLSKIEVAQLLANTDILIHPSTHHEGLPITILEAGASNCLVLATDRGGVKEVIQHNQTGIIVKPNAKAISEILDLILGDSKKIERLSRNLYELIRDKYTWQRIANDYLEVLKQISS